MLAASDLRIRQARANYFPTLKLGLDYGSEAATTGALFSGPAVIWNLALGLVQPLLAQKAIEAQVELARANNDAAAVEYAQVVQQAFREVHDALVANRGAREVLAAETQRREQIAKAYEVARLRYAAARDARLSTVNFAKALGGGSCPEAFAAANPQRRVGPGRGDAGPFDIDHRGPGRHPQTDGSV